MELAKIIEWYNKEGVSIEFQANGGVRLNTVKYSITVYTSWDGTMVIECLNDVDTKALVLMVHRYKEVLKAFKKGLAE